MQKGKFQLGKKKIIIIGILLVVAVFGYWQISTAIATRATRTFLQLPKGTIDIVNSEGETITVAVRIANTSNARSAGFKGVDEELVRDSILYSAYPFNATIRHTVEDVKLPLDIGFFNQDGNLFQVFATEVGNNSYRPDESYRYVIMAPQGFFATNNFNPDGETRILTDTLVRTPAS